MLDLDYLVIIDYAIVILIQLLASVQDLRTREINDWTWVVGALVCVPIGIYLAIELGVLALYIFGVVFSVVFGLVAYWLRAMGGADSKSIIFISSSIPPITLPTTALSVINVTPISILINSLVIALVIYVPYNVIQNVRYGKNCEALMKARGPTKLLYIVTLMCVPAYRVFRNPNNYSVAQVLGEGGFEPVIKLGLDVEDPRESLIKWLAQGRISIDTPVLTSYHIPLIIPITLGLIIYVITHMNIITALLMAL
ncbi:MAG: prepilin peptidase [Vulcanisaeta sp.]|nr:prepilin peptidase [Vulcanisaeta sp.]